MLFRVLSFLLVLSLASCLDNKDYDLNSLTINPTMALPIATGEMTMMDLVSNKDSAYLKTYPDGLLYFSYPKVFPSTQLKSLFVIPTKNSTSEFTLPPGTLPASGVNTTLGTITPQVDFGLSPQKLTEILLKGGSLNYSISQSQPTTPALPLEVIVTLTDVVNKSTQVPLTFTAGIGSGTKPLKDYLMRMIANKFNVKFDLVVKAHAATYVPTNTKVSILLSFAGLDFSYIKGFLGDQTVSLPQQTIPITVFSTSLNKSKVSFVQPKITLSVDDYYGVPCEITLSKLQAEKPGSSLPLQITPASPFNLNIPTLIGNFSNTSLTVTNAGPVVNFAPTQLVYAGSIRINKGLTSGTNFLTDSTLRVTLNTEVPLYGSASGVTMLDTMDLDFGEQNSYSVSSSTMKVTTLNEMPLDGYIQIYLMDKGKHITDSIFTPNQTYLVKASTVDSNGELQKASSGETKLDISTDKVNKVFASKYLVVKANLSTARDTNGVLLNVKFKSSYKLKINVGLLAKMSILAK